MGRKIGTNKESKWKSKGGGMGKHRKSGVAHNHAHTIAQNREEQKRLEEEAKIKKQRKGKSGTVKDIFENYN
jgi:hypothetical protein